MAQIVYNAATCCKCLKTIVSYHVHDFKKCGCPNEAFIDGGTQYIKYGANDMKQIVLNTVYDNEDFSKVRQYAYRGSRGKDGMKPLSYIAIRDMDDDYLKAVIEYGGAPWHIDLIKKEQKYREELGRNT